MTPEEITTGIFPPNARRYQLGALFSDGESKSNQEFEFKGKAYKPRIGKHWSTTVEGLQKLADKNRIEIMGSVLRYRRFVDDFIFVPLTDRWDAVQLGTQKLYIVQTSDMVLQRCILISTDPGDLVLDITCGSGTTAYVAEKWGRRWITVDTSRVAITLAKQRLMTARYDYYELAHPKEGVSSGFKYKTVPHITLKSLANDEPPAQETLYDQPFIESKRFRVTGPFTVEAVPSPVVKSFEEVDNNVEQVADASIARSGETLRQSEWRDELLRTGVRAKGGRMIEFTRVNPIGGTHYLQAEAETKEDIPKKVLVCFGPEFAPLDQRLVELALEEFNHIKPKAEILLFCAFQFEEEASKDIDETKYEGVLMLKAQMNADLFTDDLKKKRSSNESFWLIGQPDVEMKPFDDKGNYIVEINGFDYYDPKTGNVDSGGKGNIAMWMLDTDYDGRSLFPSQVFFPMAGNKEGWATLAKNLKAVIDEEKLETYSGTVSLPFKPGRAVAVKIIDDRGIESLKIVRL